MNLGKSPDRSQEKQENNLNSFQVAADLPLKGRILLQSISHFPELVLSQSKMMWLGHDLVKCMFRFKDVLIMALSSSFHWHQFTSLGLQ